MIISRELLLRYIYLNLLKMQSEKTRYKKILVILFQNVNSHFTYKIISDSFILYSYLTKYILYKFGCRVESFI